MVEVTDAIQNALVTIAVAFISGLSVVAIAYLKVLRDKALAAVDQINNNTTSQILNEAINKAYMLVGNVVTSLEQEEKQAILEAITDGKVTRDELNELKSIAIDRVVNQLGTESVDILTDAFGDLTQYIGDLVSSKVYELKNSNSASTQA